MRNRSSELGASIPKYGILCPRLEREQFLPWYEGLKNQLVAEFMTRWSEESSRTVIS